MGVNARASPWPRMLAEGFAIVVSILLAYGIQAWWEGAREREQFIQQVELLRAQVSDNVSGLRNQIRLAEIAVASLDAARDAISPSPEPISADSLFSLISRGLGVFDQDLEISALETILNSGLLDLSRDLHLHRQLVAFRADVGMYSRDVERFVDVRTRVFDYIYSVSPAPVLAAQGFRRDPDPFPTPVELLLRDYRLEAYLGELLQRQSLRVQRATRLVSLGDSILGSLNDRGS